MKCLAKIVIATLVLFLTNAAHAVCDGYNTGGAIDCYNNVGEIPSRGVAVRKLATMENIVKTDMITYGANNVSIVVIKGQKPSSGKVVYNRSFGHAVSDWRTRSGYGYFTQEENGLYMIGSLTKGLIEALILEQISQGRVSMSDNLFCLPGNTAKCWLTGFTSVDTRTARITIQNVFDMKTGYGDDVFAVPYSDFQKNLSVKMQWDPGTNYHYINWGHQILGEVANLAEPVAGGYEELIRKYLLRPIGNADSTGYLLRDSRPQFRDPRNVWYTSLFALDSLYGDGKNGGVADYGHQEDFTSSAAWVSTPLAYAKFAHKFSPRYLGDTLASSAYVYSVGDLTIVLFSNKGFTSNNALDVVAWKMGPKVLEYLKTVSDWPTDDVEFVSSALVPVIEYSFIRPETGREAYFRTGSIDEQNNLASALASDPNFLLKPTGKTYKAWAVGYTGNDVRRFVFDIKNTTGQSIGASHFYALNAKSADGNNYSILLHKNNPFRKPELGVMYEAATFSAYTVDTNRSCRSGTVGVYQIYNIAFDNFSSGKITINDGNHRFSTDIATVNEMVAKGWKNEGIAYCVAP